MDDKTLFLFLPLSFFSPPPLYAAYLCVCIGMCVSGYTCGGPCLPPCMRWGLCCFAFVFAHATLAVASRGSPASGSALITEKLRL